MPTDPKRRRKHKPLRVMIIIDEVSTLPPELWDQLLEASRGALGEDLPPFSELSEGAAEGDR